MFFKGFLRAQLLETDMMRHKRCKRWVCSGVVPRCQLEKHFSLWVSGVQTVDNQAEREIRGLVQSLGLFLVLHLRAVEGKPELAPANPLPVEPLGPRGRLCPVQVS